MRSIDDDGDEPLAGTVSPAQVAPAAATPARGRSLDDDEDVLPVSAPTPKVAPMASVVSPEAAQAAQEAVARAKVQAQVASRAAMERAGHLAQSVRNALGRVTRQQQVVGLVVLAVLAVSVPAGYGARYWWIHRPVAVEAPVTAPVASTPERPAPEKAVPAVKVAEVVSRPPIEERPATAPLPVAVAPPAPVPVTPAAANVTAAGAPAPVSVAKAKASVAQAARPKSKPANTEEAQARKAWEREQSDKLDAFFSKKQQAGSP